VLGPALQTFVEQSLCDGAALSGVTTCANFARACLAVNNVNIDHRNSSCSGSPCYSCSEASFLFQIRLHSGGGTLLQTVPTQFVLFNLTDLLLYTNQLVGSIPSQFGLLSPILKLSVSRNQLTGSIPSQLGVLPSIQQLILYTNPLTGSIPSQFGLLSSLQRLDLADASLIGSIPSQLGLLPSLQNLYLRDNQLTGSVPYLNISAGGACLLGGSCSGGNDGLYCNNSYPTDGICGDCVRCGSCNRTCPYDCAKLFNGWNLCQPGPATTGPTTLATTFVHASTFVGDPSTYQLEVRYVTTTQEVEFEFPAPDIVRFYFPQDLVPMDGSTLPLWMSNGTDFGGFIIANGYCVFIQDNSYDLQIVEEDGEWNLLFTGVQCEGGSSLSLIVLAVLLQ